VSRPRVVVIGSVNADITVRAERLPGRGETVTGGTAHRGGGGKGANAAVAAARAGADVRLVAAVGDDEPGASALAELRAAGVGVEGVVALPGIATGTALIVVDAAGDNQIAVASGANHELAADHVEAALGASAGASPTAFLISFEIPDAAILAAARHAAATAGAPLVVNPAPARPLPEGLAATRPILTPNQHEAAALTGADDPEAAARALASRTGAPAIVTLGARGALLATPEGATTRHPAPAVQAVDATGAGDVFNGVLAAALAGGAALPGAVDAAVAAAAASVTRPGAR
jgi:ribokinase